MEHPQLIKSRAHWARGFRDLRPLKKPEKALGFRPETLQVDMDQAVNGMTGWVCAKTDHQIAVVAEKNPQLKNHLLIEFLDFKTGQRVGNFSVLFRPQHQEILFGVFNLTPIRNLGLGQKLAATFMGYFPKGTQIFCVVGEEHSKKYLHDLTQGLIRQGKIIDWRQLHTPCLKTEGREVTPFPPEDLKKLEQLFLKSALQQKTPLFQVLRALGARFNRLAAGLSQSGELIFQVGAKLS